jgi:hypothetical protein
MFLKLVSFFKNLHLIFQLAIAFTAPSAWTKLSTILPYNIYFNTTTGNGDTATPMIKAIDEAVCKYKFYMI